VKAYLSAAKIDSSEKIGVAEEPPVFAKKFWKMKILNALAALIEWLKRFRVVQLFTIYLRYLIGSAFVYASVPKILGERFTQIPTSNPVGFYFEAMYQTGFYWNFLGWGQMVAAVLMMTQRFAALGATLFYPIIINVWLVTWSVGFKGTPVITFLMFLGTTYLLVWEYRRLVPMLQHESRLQMPSSDFDDSFMRKPVWIWLGVFLIACVLALPTDPKRAVWYILLGFFTALGLLIFHLFKK
jgi:hypothetical protein